MAKKKTITYTYTKTYDNHVELNLIFEDDGSLTISDEPTFGVGETVNIPSHLIEDVVMEITNTYNIR